MTVPLLHLNILLPLTHIHLLLLPAIHRRALDPKHVVAANQDLAERRSHLLINVLLRVGELDIHVRVDGDQHAAVLGVSPLEADDDFFVDANGGLVPVCGMMRV